MIIAEDGCVVLYDADDERLVFTRGQAEILANIAAPYSLVLAKLLREAAAKTPGTDFSSDREIE